jgi:glycosyltransferase involved in cell wall biosynthesis
MPIPSPLRRKLGRSSASPKILPGPYQSGRLIARPRCAKKVLFASAHSIVDFSNGASVATLDVLEGLTSAGFDCQAFCAGKLDFQKDACLDEIADAMHEPHQDQPSVCGSQRANVMYTRRLHVPVTIVRLESTRHVYDRPEEVHTVVAFFQKFLDTYRPDVMLTYGGDPITMGMIAQARQREIPVVFTLHNFAYTNSEFFSHVDYCLVASDFARRHYRDRVGLDCQALSYPVDWDRVQVKGRDPRFVTFVNPCVEKGVYPFARIAYELGRRRPDIPLLVVESRGTKENLGACGLELAAAGNLQVMTHTTDPRRFWEITRIALLPSLWWENQPLVAIEAMINGIPVIGSDRGGIPETVGNGGILLTLPDRVTPLTKIVPEADEVEPWVETIIRLWDDQALYAERSQLAGKEAERWRPGRLRPLYAEFFRNVRLQPGAPVVSRTDEVSASAGPALNGAIRSEPTGERSPLSVVVCVSDDAALKANLLSSPGLTGPGSPHEVILIHEAPSAAAGLVMGLMRAKHKWVVCVHQHVHFSEGWDRLMEQQLLEAERRFGPVGVAGVYGVGEVISPRNLTQPLGAERIGWVVERGRELRDGPELPAPVATLDELLLVVRRDSGLRFDPALGFHLYGADICLQARERGLAVVALGALCHQNSKSIGLAEEFYQSAAVFARKWSHRLPIATPCVIIDRGGDVYLLGNASAGPRSIAYAVVNVGATDELLSTVRSE